MRARGERARRWRLRRLGRLGEARGQKYPGTGIVHPPEGVHYSAHERSECEQARRWRLGEANECEQARRWRLSVERCEALDVCRTLQGDHAVSAASLPPAQPYAAGGAAASFGVLVYQRVLTAGAATVHLRRTSSQLARPRQSLRQRGVPAGRTLQARQRQEDWQVQEPQVLARGDSFRRSQPGGGWRLPECDPHAG